MNSKLNQILKFFQLSFQTQNQTGNIARTYFGSHSSESKEKIKGNLGFHSGCFLIKF
jgi:hypothetical protein